MALIGSIPGDIECVSMLVDVLGPVRLSTDEGVAVEVAERHLRLLLASLVAAAGEPVPAETMIDRLWHAELPGDPRKVLQAKISRLRATLDRARPGAGKRLTHSPAGYRLEVEPADVDTEVFSSLVRAAGDRDADGTKVASLAEALLLWRGEPFGDAHTELWLAPVTTSLHTLRGDAVEALVETLVQLGDPHRALAEANGQFEDLTTREGLVGWVMTALYQVGRQQEALRLFETLRRRLSDELGADPQPRTRDLHARILRQDPALTTPAPTTPAPAAGRPAVGRSNLPAETDPLIGRRVEAAEIDTLLAGNRLVTLTGTGGVGKTRLALQVARRHAAGNERGVWFVDLGELSGEPKDQQDRNGRAATGERIASLAADRMGLPEFGSPNDGLDRLIAALAARPAMLVLDNAEHVVEEAARFAAEVLRRAALTRVLVTSREPLGLPAEQRFHVDMLATRPGRLESTPGSVPVTPPDSGDAVSENLSDAAAFFVIRAQASDPAFGLDDRVVGQIEELCRRLDGLPLALELAASRIRGLTVDDLLERIDDRLSLLGRPGRAAPPRQRTLRGMIDWSWSLLDETERAVLRRLAVHPGTVDLTAAEAICSDTALVDRADVTETMLGLVDRSLVTAFPGPSGMRYGLLESIATYAFEKLDQAGERAAAAARHLNHYSDFASAADAGLRSREQRHWLARFAAERSQLDHALDQALRAGDGHHATLLTLSRFWCSVCLPGSSTNVWADGYRALLDRDLHAVMELSGGDHASVATLAACLRADPAEMADRVTESLSEFPDESLAKGRVQWFAGATLMLAGLREVGEGHIDHALSVLARHGQQWDMAVAVCRRDWLLVTLWRETPRGPADGRSVRELLSPVDAGYGRLHELAVQHRTAELIGDHRRSAEAVATALQISRELDIASEIALWLTASAIGDIRNGSDGEAMDKIGRARRVAAEIGYTVGAAYADLAESMIERGRRNLVRARALLDRWRTSPAAIDAELLTEFEEGFLAVQENDPPAAGAALASLTSFATQESDWGTTARMLELSAAVAALGDDAAAAAALLGTAAAVRDRANAEPTATELADIESTRALAAESLSGPELSLATDRGRGLDPIEQLGRFAAAGPVVRRPHTTGR